ncbi:MAG: carbohydrate kinase [Melioribacteraceae bacterium]|nr:carbohydrate kinase [Melioribacteraceae bacterium]MCF8353769.1 carbohydrate kinase [Melioribacteraceae bacterium]MCF8392421.1 carbohydrate kinase [Melioribacteraceae bacterium]MCF8418333.1 carbohydrate kinase [Melioribacteraceae bacterium]
MKYLLGFDVGSSSVKATLINAETGEVAASSFSPEIEMPIDSKKPGWAEQHPDLWWEHIVKATKSVIAKCNEAKDNIESIGISYQMHGLVIVDKNKEVLYPSIIWCDSRAVSTGNKTAEEIGIDSCLNSYLNSPGNFTLSKLKWVKDNLPEIYERIYKFMLPGDYIAMKLTGKICTTISGLSEGIGWNFDKQEIAYELFDHLGIDRDLIADIVPTFGEQGLLSSSAANELGIKNGIPVSYRAGDQPNNAFSLNVLEEGEVAATAGTSGVVYGISKKNTIDKNSRVNSFAHVNYTIDKPNKGVLLCINGTAILYRWLRTEILNNSCSYNEMNELSREIPLGSEGVLILPFGNGAERSLNNEDIHAQITGIDFNRHTKKHLIRASLEGIVFSFRYGLEIMKEMGLDIKVIKVGNANLFLSELFTQIFSDVCNVNIEIYNTDGSQGAARGAGIGSGYYKSFDDAFRNLQVIREVLPDKINSEKYEVVYHEWRKQLTASLRK